MNATFTKFLRTCQECGNIQEDKEPEYGVEPSDSYKYKKCKRCKSESLDYGSTRTYDAISGKEIEWDGE